MDDSKYQIDLLTALNERLMSSEKMYRHIAECTGDLFVYFNYKISPAKIDMIGNWDEYFGEKISNHPFDDSYVMNLFAEEDQDDFRIKMLELERNGIEAESIEIRSRNKRYWFACKAQVLYNHDGEPIEKILLLRDITKNKINSEELEYLAFYDTLTGVHNRNYFIRNLRDFCEKADAEKASVEVMFIDIDDFKKINDTVGLLFGDELVQEFGQFLNDFNNNYVNVGRFGSDVFVISVYNPCGARSANVIYRKILERLRHPFILSNRAEIKLSITAGVAEYPESGRTALEVINNAEIVLYRAKEKGKNNIQYFEPDIINKFNENITIEQKLKDAIENEDFQLYFQPQFYALTGKIRGAEALIRWPDDNGGYITEPLKFIPIAEKNGAIIPIGNWVIKESLRTLNEFRIKYHIPFVMCINISAVQLEKDNFIEQLQHIIQMYEINPEQVELEITESVLINNFDDVIDKIKTIRGIGMKVSLDDFGTGYSSLSYLKNLPIDTLKIDKSFIEGALNSEVCDTITESVISMAKKLGIETVAEGVETKEQFNYLRKNRVDVLQGYLLGKPVNRMEFEKILIRQMP